VLGLSGWLLSFTPGKVDTDDVDYAIEETIVDEANGLNVTVSLDPGRVGLNALRVEVREPAADITGLRLTFVAPTGSAGQTIEQPISLSGRGVAVSPEGGGVPFNVPGAWTLQVSATTPRGTSTASNPFDVRSTSGDIVTPGIGSTPAQPAVTAATTSTSTTTPG
jgi:hypothetical protein